MVSAHAVRQDGDPEWTSDAMLDSGWFGVVPIFVRSGVFRLTLVFKNELTSECRRNVSLV